MKKIFLIVIIMFLMNYSQAFANYSFSFINNDTNTNVSGTLFTATNGPGPLIVTGGFMTGSLGDATIFVGNGSGLQQTSPLGAFWYDNVLYPGSSPMLNTNGLLFVSANGVEINIWGNTSTTDYSFYTYAPGVGYSIYSTNLTGTSTSTFAASTVPIPGALLLFAPGLVGMALMKRRFSK
jgi:hypothetical protein